MSHFLGDILAQSGSTQLACILAVIAVITFLVRRWTSRSDLSKKFLTPNPPKDIVILHQYGKALTVPSISPFVMKLETFMRVAKIPYINKYSRQPGPRGKLPWIQYNDRVIPDSQICIQFLNSEKNVDLNQRLKPDQVSIGHLVRITVEESLYRCMVMWRLVFEKSGEVYKKLGLPSLIIWYMRRKARSGLWSHGIGRYSQQEVIQIMEDDLSAVSNILGDNKFLFGNNVCDVTEFDCALFGQLCQLVWQMPGTPVEENIAVKYPNLVRFCENMKMAFWPDWEDKIMHPSTKSEVSNHSRPSYTTQTSRKSEVKTPSRQSVNNQLSRNLEVTIPSKESDNSHHSKQLNVANSSRNTESKLVSNAENGKKESTNVTQSLQTFPNIHDVFDTSGTSNLPTSETSSYRTQGLVNAFNEDIRQSILKSYNSQTFLQGNQVTALRSRKVSASTILANNATILPAQ